MEISPIYAHLHVASLVKTGFPSASTVVCEGIQAPVDGTQGCGVSTPSAADVAAAT